MKVPLRAMPVTSAQKKPLLSSSFVQALAFFLLFVFFIYGALLIGLLGLSDWLIHSFELLFFQEWGGAGIALMASLLLGAWVLGVLGLASLGVLIARKAQRPLLIPQLRLIIFFAFFHIFALPWIFWRAIRRHSPALVARHRRHLRSLARSEYMQERLRARRHV